MAKHQPMARLENGTEEKSRLGTNILWNYVSGLTSVFGLLLLYPLAIHVVGSESYGLWVLAIGGIQLLTMSDFGLGTGIVRSLTEIEETELVTRRRFVTTAVQVFFVLAVLLSALYVLLFPVYLRQLDIPAADKPAVVPMVILAGVTLFVSVLGRAFNSILWAEDRPDIERKAAVVAILLRGLGYGVLLPLDGGLLEIVLVECFSLMVPPIVCAVAVRRRYAWQTWAHGAWAEHGKPLLRMSSVLSIGSLSQLGVYQLPLFIVGPTLGLHAATAFGALMRVYQSCRLVVSWSALPFTYPLKRAERREFARQIKSCLNLTLNVGLLMMVPLIALPGELLELWVGPEFVFAATALGVVSLGVLAEAVAQPADLVLTLRGNPLKASMLRLLTLVLTVPATFLAASSGQLDMVMFAAVGPSLLVAGVQSLAASRSEPFRITSRDWIRWAIAVTVASLCAVVFIAAAQYLTPHLSVVTCAIVLGALALQAMRSVRRTAR
ncbi:lipopolysaccharide biosynthesis protein [Kocuria arenosa]|uniref:lipopolysaccharide biosynthesis protein n=1 Tax=Kocuria arenosa TaxID=3071446 RepID=UPI0034D52D41